MFNGKETYSVLLWETTADILMPGAEKWLLNGKYYLCVMIAKLFCCKFTNFRYKSTSIVH